MNNSFDILIVEDILRENFGDQSYSLFSEMDVEANIGMMKRFIFYVVNIMQHDVLLVYLVDMSNTEKLREQLEILRKKNNKEIVLILPKTSKMFMRQLIHEQIAFITYSGNIFLPFIYIKMGVVKEKVQINYFTPTTQLLYLYIYKKEANIVMNPMSLANETGLSHMSIYRSLRELLDLGIVYKYQEMKTMHVLRLEDKREYLARGLSLLQNPIGKKVYVERKQEMQEILQHNHVLTAGVSALSRQTMLAPHGVHETYALDSKVFKQICAQDEINRFMQRHMSEQKHELLDYIVIELWKYNPLVLVKKEDEQIVDSISLYLSLEQEQDERVQGERTELLEKIMKEE